MKAIALFALSTILSYSNAFALQAAIERDIELVASNHDNLFIIRVDRKFSGADVEVTYSNGEVVTGLKMEKRKLIIDFCNARIGSYVIKVKNGNDVQEFKYIKK